MTLSMSRYDCAACAGPRRTATSASRTCRASTSASEYTATERMPSWRNVRITRHAISPRFATSTVRMRRGAFVAGVWVVGFVVTGSLTSGRRRS